MDPRFRGDDRLCLLRHLEPFRPLARSLLRNDAGAATMTKTRIFLGLLAFLLALCLATSADARRWRWGHYGGYERSDRAERFDDRSRRARAAEFPDPAVRGSRGAFGTIVERLVSGCGRQAEELASLPYDDITRIAAPNDAQRAALEALRGTAGKAAERFAADCPQSVPVPELRLEAVEQSVDAATAAFTAVEPALQKFYSALDDEQKARLLRDMTLADSQPRAADRRADRSRDRWRDPDRGDRRSRYRAYARAYDPNLNRDPQSSRTDGMASNRAANSVNSPPHATRACPGCAYEDASRASPTCGGEGSGVGVSRSSSRRCQPTPTRTSTNTWSSVCEDLTSALRNWPVRDIERGVRLSEPQRVAFYELVTSSLKAADTLASACPAETALTPVGRMASLRARLAAVRAATAAIRPALTRFYEALDQGQKLRFAGMS
jgi:LTXXQ motif family protein